MTMSKPTEITTFTLQLDQLLRGETIPDEMPEMAFARRLRAVDWARRSRIETSLRAHLLSSKNPSTFSQTPTKSPHGNSPLSRLAPTLAFGAAMVLLVLFLVWALTNTTPQPAVNATETAPVVTPLDSDSVLVVGTPTHAPTTGDPLTVLQALTTQYANDILSGSGWLHITKRIYVNGDSGALPNPWLADDWYFLDDQKQVVQAVSIQADENGTPVQVKVLRDRQWVHLTQDTTSPADPFIPNLDSDFVVEATNALANGSTLQMSDLYFDGQFVGIRFSYLEDDDEVEGIFDENTGQMLSFTGTFIEDQEKQIIYSITVITQERTTLPPANILSYLDQDPTPNAPLPPIDTPSPGTYTVQDGDTLSKIASDFGLTVETLIALNGLSPEAPALFPGQVLIVVPFDPANLRFPAQATVNELSNLRSGPGTQFEVVGTLPGGTLVTVLDANEGFDWYKIGYEASTEGTAWVYGPLLTFQVQAASDSIPTDGTVNPALSDLTFKWVFNEDGSAPEIYLGDIYASDMYIGRADFGEIPGGLCDRSWNGVLLAFTYAKDGASTLRWVSIKDVTMYQNVPGYTLHSPVTFAPNDFRLTFVGCKEDDCGIFVKDLGTNSAVIKLSDGDTYAHPAWSPDGQYIIIWYGEPINANGINNIKVVHAETGEVLYMGDPTLDASPLQAWNISPMYRPMTSTERCEAAPETLSPSATLAPDGTYTVQEGDTLAGIANHFGVAIEILLSLNGLSPEAPVIFPGQVLIVAPPITNP
jgi:LysM repeat protein